MYSEMRNYPLLLRKLCLYWMFLWFACLLVSCLSGCSALSIFVKSVLLLQAKNKRKIYFLRWIKETLLSHSFFNSFQILRLFSESTENIGVLKVDLAEAKRRLSSRNKQLHQLWYRSVTLRHIISLLDQIEGISKVCPILFPVFGSYQAHVSFIVLV